jgi:UrcA family protein
MNSRVKTHNSFFLACSAAMLLACVLAGSNAFAAEQSRSETVKFADLKVDTSAGVAELYRRINSAARRVCLYDPTGVQSSRIWQACVRPTVDAAVAKVNNPLLTALHTGHNPSPATAMIKR